jgi:rSAM/selenodomain-associated transferase 2
MQVSIVIPVLNMAESLIYCLEALRVTTVREVIVVDGGSTDASAEIARAMGAVVLSTAAGRGLQMQAGAIAARSDWLMFLHADTVLSPGWPAAVRGMQPAVAGYFNLCFNSRRRAARWLEFLVAWRCRWLHLPYGDQGLIIHRDLLMEIGGVPLLPLMEDVALARRLGRRRLKLLAAKATTSAARYEQGGFLRRPLKNLLCLALYFAGVSPGWIKKIYG